MSTSPPFGRARTRRALALAAETFPVPEWQASEPGPKVLPGYTDEAWAAFVSAAVLHERYPNLTWEGNKTPGSVQAVFHKHYWDPEWLAEDEPTPGLGDFVRRVEDRGGVIVFVSGRWLVNHIPPTRIALKRAGIAAPVLLIGNHLHEENVVAAKDEVAWSDSEVKRRIQADVRERYGVPVAVFDDRQVNREAIIEANRDYLRAGPAECHFGSCGRAWVHARSGRPTWPRSACPRSRAASRPTRIPAVSHSSPRGIGQQPPNRATA